MIFRQVIQDDLGCASYVVGDRSAGIGAVVDPRLDVAEYRELAHYLGIELAHVFETHNHADHVSGHGRLAAATGAVVHIHRDAGVDSPHQPFEDGDEFELGALTIRVIHTPGHRPEHSSFALIDTSRGEEPWAVLTGDTLFVGDVARPDLAIEAEDGARLLFATLHQRLLTLPDTTEVWPGHLGGSLCGGPGMDMKVSSTIGYERLHNPMLQATDEGSFVERSLAGILPQPPNHLSIVARNREPFGAEPPAPLPLSPRELSEKLDDAVLVVDVRSEAEFGEGHIPGSICIPTDRSGFGSRLGWLADSEREVLIVSADDEAALFAATLAASVRAGRVTGYLRDGMTSWRRDGRPVQELERRPAREIGPLLDEVPGLQLLDVRDQHEWDAAHVDAAIHAPYHSLDTIPAGLDPARPVAVYCGGGPRAAIGASMLQRAGAERVIQLTDGGARAVLAATQGAAAREA